MLESNLEGLIEESEVSRLLGQRPEIGLRQDRVPPELDPGRSFEVMCRRVLDNSPINFHREARRRRLHSAGDDPQHTDQ